MADGRWWALGAVAAIAAAGAVRRSGRGSSAEMVYRRQEAEGLLVALKQKRRHYGYGASTDYKDAYAFDIKAHHADPPPEVEKTLPYEWIAENISEYATNDLEGFVEFLQERYPWIGREWDVKGAQGGWLVLFDPGRVLSELENALDCFGPDHVRCSFRGQSPVHKKQTLEQIDKRVAEAKQRLADLEAIGGLVREAVRNFEKWIEEPQAWEYTLERYERVREQEGDEGEVPHEEDEEDEDG